MLLFSRRAGLVAAGALALVLSTAAPATQPIPYEDASGVLHQLAAEPVGSDIVFDSVPNVGGAPVTAGNPLPVASAPGNAPGAYGAPVTVGTASTTLVSASTATKFLDIQNGCTSQNMTILVGGQVARILPPLASKTWEGTFVPSDAVTATVPTGMCPAYVGVK